MARRTTALLRASILGSLAYISKSSPSHLPLQLKPSPLLPPKPSPLGPLQFLARRSFSSSPAAGPVIVVTSAEELDRSLSKARDDGAPTIFYFTAAWCGPCRFISPVIEELSKKYPHVTTYKIDIDLEGLGNTLSKLQISAVPTLHFFQDGKKANEVVGADINRLKETMESLYKPR